MSKGKWKGGDTFDVTGEGNAEARAMENQQEPLVNKPTNFASRAANGRFATDRAGDAPDTFPTIYGVDFDERRRQAMLRDITTKQLSGQASGLGDVLGDRQVMLTDRDLQWVMNEQDRLGLIEKDRYFEKSAIESGMFSTPHGLQYLRGIKPDYFERREKLAKWVANAQLKLFDIRFNGVKDQQDFNFMYMLQGLDESQKKILTKPVWLLNTLTDVDASPNYQPGVFARSRLPDKDQVMSFAGMGSIAGTSVTQASQGGISPWSWDSSTGMRNAGDGVLGAGPGAQLSRW